VPATAALPAGRDAPPPGALAGRLVYAESDGCRLRVLELASLSLGKPGPATGCRLWASPRGDFAVVTERGENAELRLARLDGARPLVVRTLGAADSPPTWSVDGTKLAWCTDGSTVVLDLVGGQGDGVPGCYPEFGSDGVLVTRSVTGTGLVVRRDGRVVVRPDTGLQRDVVGHGVLPDGRLVLAVHRRPDEAVLELWRGGELERTVPIRTYGMIAQAFGVSVDLGGETEAAVTPPSNLDAGEPDGVVTLVDFRNGRPIDGVVESPEGGVARSPDGAWVALSTGEEVLVFARGAGKPTFRIPLAARAIAWR
jgi:hypothetical protein